MNRRIQWFRATSVAATVLVAAMSMACGGGGGGSSAPPSGGGLNASFNPDMNNPPATSVSMADGGGGGANFLVDIMVRDIDDVAGVAFALEFDSSEATFMGPDASGSALAAGGVNLDVEAQAAQNDPDVLLVVVARQGAGNTGVDIAGSQRVLTLMFRADGNGASDLSFDVAGRQRAVTTCPSAAQPCVDVTEGPLTWHGGTMTAN